MSIFKNEEFIVLLMALSLFCAESWKTVNIDSNVRRDCIEQIDKNSTVFLLNSKTKTNLSCLLVYWIGELDKLLEWNWIAIWIEHWIH